MSQGSTWAFDIWLVTYDMQQCDMRDVKVWETVTFFAYSWRTMMFSMSQGSTKRVTCGMWQPDELPHENKSCWVCQKQHLAFGIFQRDKRRCQKTSIVIFAYELWVFCLDMKTKVVSHVPRSIWHMTVWQKIHFRLWGITISSKFAGPMVARGPQLGVWKPCSVDLPEAVVGGHSQPPSSGF